jgi:hypothetical protein
LADNDLFFTTYLVIYLDLLGQKDAIKRIGDDFPSTDESMKEFKIQIRESLGKVLITRKMFEEYFEASKKFILDTEIVPPEYREEFVACSKSEIFFYPISDSIIISVPLPNDHENVKAVQGIFSALLGTGAIILEALAMKIAIRGGIDVGIGVMINDREIYGPVLEQSVYLENQLAEYPRCLVGKQLVSYLDWVGKKQFQNSFGKMAQIIAGNCMKMLFLDNDGRVSLDFLGSVFSEFGDRTLTVKKIMNAYEFLSHEHERYAKNDDAKLTSRYYRLMRYFISRRDKWGIELQE